MASNNFGEQLITFQYNQPATSETFNRLLYNTLPKGVYNGAVLSKPNPLLNRVSISPGTFVFTDPDYSALTDDSVPETLVSGLAVKVQTTVSITDIEVTSSAPYVVMYFNWQNVSGNYLDFDTVAFSDLESKHVIIGRACFQSGVLQSTFDYTRRDEPALYQHEQEKDDLRAQASENTASTGDPDQVYVSPGEVIVNNVRIDWAGGPSPAFPDTNGIGSGNERIDLLYLNDSGSLAIITGTPATSPSVPQYPKDGVVLAHIQRGNNRTVVQGNEITQVDFRRYVGNNLLWGTGAQEVDSREIPVGSTISQSVTGGSDLSIADTTSVRDAIEDVAQWIYDGSGLSNDSIGERHIDWGTGAGQVNASDLPVSTSGITAGDVASALTGLADGSEIDDNAIVARHVGFNAGDIPVTGYADIQAGIDSLESGKLNNTTDTFSGTLTINGDINSVTSVSAAGTTIASTTINDESFTGPNDLEIVTFTIVRPSVVYVEVDPQSNFIGDTAIAYLDIVQNNTWSNIATVTVTSNSAQYEYGIMLNPGSYRLRAYAEDTGGEGLSDDVSFYVRSTGVFGADSVADAT